jgi:hypothetical protein
MPAPDKIKQLVETFEQNLKEYQTRKNETELRRQFLDPFFEALGWDVSNNKGYDERRKEVAHVGIAQECRNCENAAGERVRAAAGRACGG